MKKRGTRREVTGVELATPDKPLVEPRLWGTWKSDRRKTFEYAVFPRATPASLRKLRSLFGKLVVTWTKTTYSSFFDVDRFMGHPNDRTPDAREYSVVARDPGRAVVCLGRRLPNPKRKPDSFQLEMLAELDKVCSLKTIEFDEDRGYRISLGTYFEYFRRVD
jgi:hypothetical protein